MTVSEAIVSGLSSKDLKGGLKGCSRAAIKSYLIAKGALKEGPTANGAVKRAISKLVVDGSIIAVTNHRFKVNVAKFEADLKVVKAAKKAKADIQKKKLAEKLSIKKAKGAAKKKKAATKKAELKAKKAAKKAVKKSKKKTVKKTTKKTKKKAKKATKKKTVKKAKKKTTKKAKK
jgi:hypothetical protein